MSRPVRFGGMCSAIVMYRSPLCGFTIGDGPILVHASLGTRFWSCTTRNESRDPFLRCICGPRGSKSGITSKGRLLAAVLPIACVPAWANMHSKHRHVVHAAARLPAHRAETLAARHLPLGSPRHVAAACACAVDRATSAARESAAQAAGPSRPRYAKFRGRGRSWPVWARPRCRNRA